MYTGVMPPTVLHLKPNPAMSLDRISNAFSGDPSAIAAGGLYTLALSQFQPASTNLGFSPAGGLPDQLSGVEVKFDGVAAPILATSPGQVTVATPAEFTGQVRAPQLTEVQVFYGGAASNRVWMPISKSLPGLLMTDSASGDGTIRNQDGTLNSAANPAAPGSTITLFVTGVGMTNPEAAPGSIATSTGISPVTPLYSTWSTYQTPLSITSIPGFISAVFEIPVVVPLSFNPPGTTRAEFQLIYELPAGSLLFPASNTVGIYVQ
jgi:uncharacterized protein (TIGR03437 family)